MARTVPIPPLGRLNQRREGLAIGLYCPYRGRWESPPVWTGRSRCLVHDHVLRDGARCRSAAECRVLTAMSNRIRVRRDRPTRGTDASTVGCRAPPTLADPARATGRTVATAGITRTSVRAG